MLFTQPEDIEVVESLADRGAATFPHLRDHADNHGPLQGARLVALAPLRLVVCQPRTSTSTSTSTRTNTSPGLRRDGRQPLRAAFPKALRPSSISEVVVELLLPETHDTRRVFLSTLSLSVGLLGQVRDANSPTFRR